LRGRFGSSERQGLARRVEAAEPILHPVARRTLKLSEAAMDRIESPAISRAKMRCARSASSVRMG